MKTQKKLCSVKTLLGSTALFVSVGIGSVATAQETVTIRLPDQNMEVSGELLGYDGNVYVLRTIIGDLNIRAEGAICDGATCPVEPEAPAPVPTASAPAVAGQTVRITGSLAMTNELLPAILNSLATAQGGQVDRLEAGLENAPVAFQQTAGDGVVNYAVNPLSPGLSFRQLVSEDAALNMAYRPISEREVARFARQGLPDLRTSSQQYVIGLNPFVLAVNPQNGVQSLTTEQLRDIFVGRYTDWSELGGASAPIVVVSRESGVEARHVSDLKIRGRGANIQSIQTLFVASSTGAAATIADNPAAIGFISQDAMDGLAQVSIIDECNNEIVPDSFGVKSEDYPLSGRMYWYLREGIANDAEMALWDYATKQTEAMAAALEPTGLVGNTISMRPHGDDQARVAGLNTLIAEGSAQAATASDMLLRLVSTTGRLSTTFRLTPDGSSFDEKTPQDIRHLADYISDNRADLVDVTFVGFSGRSGDPQLNVKNAASFGSTIMGSVQQIIGGDAEGINVQSAGFGAVAPIACPTSETQALTNERVEVWVTLKQ